MASSDCKTSAEFQLLVEACRRSFAAGPAQIPDKLDWELSLRLARFHRVQGLVWKSLEPERDLMPASIAQAFASDAQAIAVANLRSAAGSRALLEVFAEAGVALLFVKGLTLSTLVYGNIGHKSAIDVDILVEERAVARAADLLRSCGYRPVAPSDVAKLVDWHKLNKESVWGNAEAGLQVDLHSRLADNRRLIPQIDVHSSSQVVEVSPGLNLPTLGRDELFAYLCVHGASSLWFRLKWIADLAAFLHSSSTEEIEALYRGAQQLCAGRAPAQALLLADALFGSLRELPALREELREDRVNRWLYGKALQQLIGRSELVEPTSTPFGTLPIHLTQFGLLPGLAFKTSELVRQARTTLS